MYITCHVSLISCWPCDSPGPEVTRLEDAVITTPAPSIIKYNILIYNVRCPIYNNNNIVIVVIRIQHIPNLYNIIITVIIIIIIISIFANGGVGGRGFTNAAFVSAARVMQCRCVLKIENIIINSFKFSQGLVFF